MLRLPLSPVGRGADHLFTAPCEKKVLREPGDKAGPHPSGLHAVAIPLITNMAANSTSDSSSIFKDGKLKPGIYKIKSLSSQTFMDIHEHTRTVCCRPTTLLGEGMGLVCLMLQSVARVADKLKWEIKPLGAGYSVQRVGVRPPSIRGRVRNNAEHRLNRESPTSFVSR